MKKIALITALFGAVFVWVLYAYAQVDTGSYTTNSYFYIPTYLDWGSTHFTKRMDAFAVADRGINVGNSLYWSLEYPVSGDNYGAKRVPSAITITKVIAVLQEDGAETVTINFKHGADRSGAGEVDLFSANQAISSKTTGDSFTSFNDATLAANEWIWLEVTANSGVVEALDVTIELSVD